MAKPTVALFGAAGKIGARIADRLRSAEQYTALFVESGEAGITRLRERGLTPASREEAIAGADVAILAVPDVVLGQVAASIVPHLRPGTLVVCLDPAAPHGGELPARSDISYFVTHPCHPPVIGDEVDPVARRDFYGGVAAKQHIVCALMQGPESDYERGERLARCIFAPVMNAYRLTVEQMAILEPALSETVILTCMIVMKEAIDEAVLRGVPADAAREFALGHMNINLGILFGYLDARFSDGALLAASRAKELLFQPDWRKVFEPDNVRREVRAITGTLAGTRS
ncbi:MAG: phosphogluconate dehydrogenase C-terminal domain-containing protein [Nitrososphaerales archaeon]